MREREREGLSGFTAQGEGSMPGWELRPCQPPARAKEKKKKNGQNLLIDVRKRTEGEGRSLGGAHIFPFHSWVDVESSAEMGT